MTKEHEQMLNMVRSAMEIAESSGNYVASVRLLFDATMDVMQMEVNGKVYTLRSGEEKALRMAQREIGRAREDVEEEAAEMKVREDGSKRIYQCGMPQGKSCEGGCENENAKDTGCA